MDKSTILSLENINQMSQQHFVATFADVVEHSPWVAEKLWQDKRPFATLEQLFIDMVDIIQAAGPEAWHKILNLHPELSGKEAQEGSLTNFSTAEQTGLGLNQLSREEFQRIAQFNQRYRQKFAFPFVVCVRLLKSRSELLQLQELRYANTAEEELATGIAQVFQIARMRLESMFKLDIAVQLKN